MRVGVQPDGGQASSSGSERVQESVQQQEPAVSEPSSSGSRRSSSPESNTISGSRGSSQGTARSGTSGTSSSSECDDDADDDLYLGPEDVDHPGEAAAASKRFRSSSKRLRRKAALAKSVRALRPQQQGQQD